MLVRGGNSAPGDTDMLRSPGDSVVARDEVEVFESLADFCEMLSRESGWLFR